MKELLGLLIIFNMGFSYIFWEGFFLHILGELFKKHISRYKCFVEYMYYKSPTLVSVFPFLSCRVS